RVGLSAIRALDRGTAEATVEQRQRGGPYQSLADFRRRVGTATLQDAALLIRVGSFDFTGTPRAALLREAEAIQHGRLPPWWEGRDDFEPWPLDGLWGGHPLGVIHSGRARAGHLRRTGLRSVGDPGRRPRRCGLRQRRHPLAPARARATRPR